MNSEFIQAISNILPAEDIITNKIDCLTYGFDNSRRQAQADIIVFPKTESQIIEIIRLCNEYQCPVTSRGRGTGTTGATVPTQGGLVLSFERMNKIKKIDPDNRLMIVEPGVTNQEIQNAANEHGFFWAPDPTSAAFCTVGGNIAYNSAGPRAVKYGTTRDNILGLNAVIGTGKLIKCGVNTTKGVVGYDFTRLITGSEGTLAVVTQATLKLIPKPEAKRTLKVTYKTIEAAAAAVAKIMAQPTTPCALEFMDKNSLNMVREYSQVELPHDVGAMLMIEVDGNESNINQAVKDIDQASRVNGHIETELAQTAEEITALWNTRKALSPSLRKIAPKKINEDIVVPVSNMATLVNKLDALSNEFSIPIVNFGHAGNGNIHVNLLVDPDNPEQMKNAEICLDKVFDLVLSLDGTLSGEHGIGLEKRDFITKELGETEIQLMRDIKKQFDPNNILNPGKIP